MHYLVKLIVSGEDKEDALRNAVADADSLCEQGRFDWYSEEGRWGKSQAFRVRSKTGKKHIEDGMSAHRDDFDRALKHIRYMMENYSDDEIYNEQFGAYEDIKEFLPEDVNYLSKYQFYVAAGDKTGPYVYSLDGDVWGGCLEKERDLKYVLDKDDDNNKLWVVPIDFHN